MAESKNNITVDRTLLGLCVSLSIFLYSQLNQKLDKITYERDKLEIKTLYRDITKQNTQLLNELTELRTTIKILYKIGRDK
ncbi:MAG: hypothetical protein KC646_10310 [Candidatus Cloacimonetes bacterium]|nr:hypothetical protein [Candidatus Cloacimonadota bacterium]